MSEQIAKLSLPPEQIINLPLVNKGTAFTQKERDLLGLNGRLPSCVESIEHQILRLYRNFKNIQTPLEKYVFLMGVLKYSEMLFYQFASRYSTEAVPIIYTPTVGEAAIHYSGIYSEPKGIYLSYPLKDKIDDILANYPRKDVQVIVVTDGERILGLGDQGVGGMTIPVGKLSLYTLFGGIHPAKTLPILLDPGTNNQDLLKDDLYLGVRSPRVTGSDYDSFVDLFVKAVKRRFPKVLLQWEDFAKNNARRLLDKYRGELLSFNDDIQGTASVTLGALMAAVKAEKSELVKQRFAILGGGSAGTGIADALTLALCNEGLSKQDATSLIYIVDVDGLISYNAKHIYDAQTPYLKSEAALKSWMVEDPHHITMTDVMKNAHPTVLIGVSGQPGAFTKEMVEQMQRFVKKPIIFPLSNPTSKAEATPADLLQWTKGEAIIATGSPFAPVQYNGKMHQIGQCNNVYVFPGVGAGAVAAEATTVTDTMFLEASSILASFSPALKDPSASLFPSIPEVRKVCRAIAIGVAKRAVKDGVSKMDVADAEKRVDAIMWEPCYPTYA